MNKDESDFEFTVTDYLSKHDYVRRRRLIDYLIESHPNGTGYSEPSINRKLADMHKAGKILIESNDKKLAVYKIKKESDNASYIIDINYLGRKIHRDYVFNCFNKEDTIVKNRALKEIKAYQNEWVLSPSHLDSLVTNLGNEDKSNLDNENKSSLDKSNFDDEDISLIDSLLEILYNQIINKGVKPEDNEKFLKILRNLLEKYPEGNNKYRMLRRRVIWLLGYYNDKAVLEQLIKDAETGKLSTFQNDYLDKFTARIIENGRTELFNLEIKLEEEGDTKTTKILDEIRKKALENVKKPKEPDKTLEEVLGNPVSKQKIQQKIKGSKK